LEALKPREILLFEPDQPIPEILVLGAIVTEKYPPLGRRGCSHGDTVHVRERPREANSVAEWDFSKVVGRIVILFAIQKERAVYLRIGP